MRYSIFLLRFTVLLCTTLACALSHAAKAPKQTILQSWDALPALDVTHLLGPYRGKSVCPMCQHGYDAGVLVVVPTSITAAQRASIKRNMLSALRHRNPRFRAFWIFTEKPNSDTALSELQHEDPRWHVGYFNSQADQSAFETLLGANFREAPMGIGFMQRRLLNRFDPRVSQLDTLADQAIKLLHWFHPDDRVIANATPDTPKGQLWLAPDRLTTEFELGESNSGQSKGAGSACFDPQFADALVAAQTDKAAGTAAVVWARTDPMACVTWSGATPSRITAYSLSAQRYEAAMPSPSNARGPTEPVVGLPCDGCELVFQGLPRHIPEHAILAIDPSQKTLLLHGRVLDQAGKPVPGVVIYAHQTDAAGVYPASGTVHGRWRNWVVSDLQGIYRFKSIVPGAYPGRSVPPHIHLQVLEPGHCTYYIDDVIFAPEPNVALRGGPGLVQLQPHADGLQASRDIYLRQNILNAAICAQ